jgi:hypothetical protein
MDANPRHRDTSAAILARRVKKWRRWASELRENGWTVVEPPAKETEK